MKILKDKRGLALETALLFMMVVFFLCLSLMMIALMAHSDLKRENEALTKRVSLDQIGEDFVSSVANDMEFLVEGYTYTVDEDANGTHTLTVYANDEKTAVLLFVEVNGDANVIKWKYSTQK